MAYLTRKRIKGKTYYYVEECERTKGKVHRKWQKYLGTIEKIVKAVDAPVPAPAYAEVFDFGCPAVYWDAVTHLGIIPTLDSVLPKRNQGMSIGQYLALAAMNRGIKAVSKNSMWQWFQTTMLMRVFSGATKNSLSSQRFWDVMSLVPENQLASIWGTLVDSVLDRHPIDLSCASYDGTNFYTFIGSFNTHSSLAQRGKNKQGRTNLRQINYALFCTRKDQFPLYFDVYEGNRNDAKEFGSIIDKFFARFASRAIDGKGVTLVFDKGNNSKENFLPFAEDANRHYHFVASVKLDEHKEFAAIPNDDPRLAPLSNPRLDQVRAWRATKKIYGRDLTVVLTFNHKLHTAQFQSITNEINKCLVKLGEIAERLDERHCGRVTKGHVPTVDSIASQVAAVLHGQHMKKLVTTNITLHNGIPLLAFTPNTQELSQLAQTYLGKSIIITDNDSWSTEDIVLTYRSQYVVEDVFKHMKDRDIGCWWPMSHWTDQKIKVHGLYCSLTLMLRSLIMKTVRESDLPISIGELHRRLQGIREVVNFYTAEDATAKPHSHSVLTRMDDTQKRLFDLFHMKEYAPC